MCDDTTLPRVVPVERDIPDEFKDDYVYVKTAAAVAGVNEGTIRRNLAMQTLAGLKVGERLWLVKRVSEIDTNGDVVDPPGLDYWTKGKPGNPEWVKK